MVKSLSYQLSSLVLVFDMERLEKHFNAISGSDGDKCLEGSGWVGTWIRHFLFGGTRIFSEIWTGLSCEST